MGSPKGGRQLGLRDWGGRRKLSEACGSEKCGGVSFAQAVPRTAAKCQEMATSSKQTWLWEEKLDSAIVGRDSNFLLQTPAPPPHFPLPLFSPLKPSLLSQILFFFFFTPTENLILVVQKNP